MNKEEEESGCEETGKRKEGERREETYTHTKPLNTFHQREIFVYVLVCVCVLPERSHCRSLIG